jgi:phosphoribosylamine--glycine ligase
VVPLLAAARDFKRLDDNDGGPNTGGMGCYSPLPDVDDDLISRLLDECVEPLVGTLVARGIDYRGVLYAGLMLTADGPKVLEFNVRFGDPETQVVLPRLVDDLVELLTRTATGRLGAVPRFSDSAAVCVVQSVDGYPSAPRTGDVISGLAPDGQLADAPDGVTVFHAGTELDDAGRFRTAGGRVLGVTAVAPTLSAARDRAYGAAARISWPGCHYRNDIANDAVLGAAALR